MGKAVSKLSKDDIDDLKHVTHFHSRELQQWYKGFKRDCPSGQLSKEEFIKIHKQFFPFGDPTEYSCYAFEAFDVDDTGSVTFKEFIIGLSITSRGKLSEKLRWSFRIYDRDRDGVISYKDMLIVVKSIYKMVGSMVEYSEDEKTPEMRCDKIFKALGKTRDMTISMDEFCNSNKMDSSIIEALNIYENVV